MAASPWTELYARFIPSRQPPWSGRRWTARAARSRATSRTPPAAVKRRASLRTWCQRRCSTQSAADRRFLWACCANTTNASTCYDSLLPFAGSFHGNRVRVARAAAVLAFARLRGYHDELRRLQLQPGGTGGGRIVDMALNFCVTSAEIALGKEADSLAELRRLETAAGRRRGEQAESDMFNAKRFVSGIGSSTTLCVDDLASIGDEVLASPVGKKVLAWVANVRPYGDIALHLVASIKL